LIEKGEWNTKGFKEMKKELLKVLQIEYNPVDNGTILEKLSSELEKSHENNETMLKELSALKKSHEKLEKLIEEKIQAK
jgi:hypothetical protein